MAATDELPPLTGAAMVLGTLSLSLATFMNVLDTSIANVSLSAIGGDLRVSTTQVTWVITSFGVANAITVPLTGWLSQRFGAVRLFIASIVLFSIASLMCGLPVGAFAAVVTWGIYRRRETARRKLPIDGVGLGLLVLWVGALQIMLDKGQELDWFHSSTIVALAVVAVVVFSVFIVWELVENPYPVVDLRLFKGRNFWTGTLALSLGYGVFFGNVVLLPLWLQQYMGYTATEAGMLTAPVGILALLLSPFVGRWVGKVDPRVPLVSLVLSGLTPDRVPAASGLSNFARIVCGSFGTSIATTLWDNRAILHHAQLTEYIRNSSDAAQSYAQTLQAGGLSPQQAGAAINRSIDVESHLLAANDVFWISSILFLLMIGVIWLARPSKSNLAPRRALRWRSLDCNSNTYTYFITIVLDLVSLRPANPGSD
jgi:MFS family permease